MWKMYENCEKYIKIEKCEKYKIVRITKLLEL